MFKPDKRFASMDDVVQKIHGSIVLYDDKPHYASYNRDSGKISLIAVKTFGPSEKIAFSAEVEYNDPKLLYESPKLGFCNISENQCVFLSRIPSRNFAIGLTEKVISCTTLNDTPIHLPFQFPWADCLKDTIEGNYPSPLEILEEKNITSAKAWCRAFARNFAFGYGKNKGLRLFHNHTPLATFDTKTNRFVPIDDCNGFIESILHKNGINNYAPSN